MIKFSSYSILALLQTKKESICSTKSIKLAVTFESLIVI